MTPQQRAAQTRMDRRQLAAVVADVDDLRREVREVLRFVVPIAVRFVGLLDDAGVRRPPLEVVASNDRPRPSSRPPARLRIVQQQRRQLESRAV